MTLRRGFSAEQAVETASASLLTFHLDGHSARRDQERPGGNMMVVGCVDPRVDPTHLLGLEQGEAAVIRNVGGRITPATLRTMAMLGKSAPDRIEPVTFGSVERRSVAPPQPRRSRAIRARAGDTRRTRRVERRAAQDAWPRAPARIDH